MAPGIQQLTFACLDEFIPERVRTRPISRGVDEEIAPHVFDEENEDDRPVEWGDSAGDTDAPIVALGNQLARFTRCRAEAAYKYKEACEHVDSRLVELFETQAPLLCIREVVEQVALMPDPEAGIARLAWAVDLFRHHMQFPNSGSDPDATLVEANIAGVVETVHENIALYVQITDWLQGITADLDHSDTLMMYWMPRPTYRAFQGRE
jgi:hypothetical protein